MSSVLNLKIRVSNGSPFDVEVDAGSNVEDLKTLCEISSRIEAAVQKIVFRGKILKNEDILQTKGIQSGD